MHRLRNGVKLQNESLVNALDLVWDGAVYITYRIPPVIIGSPPWSCKAK
jgi:hypothetical protein